MSFKVDDRIQGRNSHQLGTVEALRYVVKWDDSEATSTYTEEWLEPAPKVAKYNVGDSVYYADAVYTVSGVFIDRFGDWFYHLRDNNNFEKWPVREDVIHAV